VNTDKPSLDRQVEIIGMEGICVASSTKPNIKKNLDTKKPFFLFNTGHFNFSFCSLFLLIHHQNDILLARLFFHDV